MKRKLQQDDDVPEVSPLFKLNHLYSFLFFQYLNAKRSMHSSNCQLQYENAIPSPPQEDLMMIDVEETSSEEDNFVFAKDDPEDGYTGQLERSGWNDMYYDMYYQS